MIHFAEVDRKTARSVLRDALDRANEEFRRSTAEFQTAIQSTSGGECSADRERLVRQASRRHAEAGDTLLLALTRFEEFVFGGAVPPDIENLGDAALPQDPLLQFCG